MFGRTAALVTVTPQKFQQQKIMAADLLTSVIVITTIIMQAASGVSRGHFPLENCSDNVDIISLMDNVGEEKWKLQYSMFRDFVLHFSNSVSRMNRSQLLVAQVLHHFSTHNVRTDVSSWSLQTFQSQQVLNENLTIANLQIDNNKVDSILKEKIEFVERLFNEMSGVRQTAIHVGIIFLDGFNLTQDNIRNMSTILQQRNSNEVRAFVVVVGDTLVQLTDMIVLPQQRFQAYGRSLMMAICKQCLQDEVMFEHPVGTQLLSCYKINISKQVSWYEAHQQCRNDSGRLSGIETSQELMFLQQYIFELLKNKSNVSKNETYNAHIYIGLKRDVSNYAKRFRWINGQRQCTQRRPCLPLIINHWLSGKPAGGYTPKNCGVWRFTNIWNSYRNDNGTIQTVSSDKEAFVEGWEDINCHSNITRMSLCEFSLPQKVEHIDLINIQPASNRTLERALSKGDFLSFKGNIVSVSENVANTDFLLFLKNNKKDFPMFDCGEDAGEPRYISYSLVCDFIDHCSNKRDEASCLKHPGNCKSGEPLLHQGMLCDNVKDCTDGSDERSCDDRPCGSFSCCDGSCLPLQWVNDGEFDCFGCKDNSCFMSDENIYTKNDTNCALICNTDKCVRVSQLNDRIIDCKGPEGPLDTRIGKLEPANTCKNSAGSIWAPRCVYVVDRYGGTIGCRDMSHLRDCENFQCREGYVKCQRSYCIPQHYLLDGKVDCPTGEDEHSFTIGPCTGNFACWNSTVCLHPDMVCDGHADCPKKDDELGCQTCPEGFRCTGGTLTVSGYNGSYPLNKKNCIMDKRTKYLDFTGVNFLTLETSIVNCTRELQNVKVLILSNCGITILNLNPYPALMIKKLDISYNMIHEIFSNFSYTYEYKNIKYLNVSFNKNLVSVKNLQFRFLETIDLSHTGLSYLNDSVFARLPLLNHLNLSHTLISDFSRTYFSAAFTLETLDLRGIRIADVHSFVFHDLAISEKLYVDNDQICCPQIRGSKTPAHACQAPVDAISSCFDLVKLPVQRVLLWVVAVLAVLGNMVVIVYRVIWDRSVLKTGYGLFVTNLGISDFIMGVYLLIIAGSDHFFRNIYVLYETTWKQSVLCKLAGFMATLSSEASTFFIFLITLERFLVIQFPFGENKLSKIPQIVSVVLSWFTAFSLSLIPIVFNLGIYSTNAMCLGLPLTNTRVKGWEYSVGVFIVYNFIMFLFIACGQYAIFHAMSDNMISKKATSVSSSRRAKDITIAKQLSLIVLSNFLCWFPVGLMGLVSLVGYEVSDEVYAWTTVLLLPINSAVNPVLYTIPALTKRWKHFKYGDQRTLSACL